MEKNYDFGKIENQMQTLWLSESIYEYDTTGEGELYSIDTPPPTVSGSLHIGHIFSYVQAEMIARYKRMRGYKIFYPFGFDDNGLPTERLVEKELGKSAKDFSREAFIENCLQITDDYEEAFKSLWQSLGFSVDWNLKYKTIGPLAQRISQRSFLDLYAKKKAYLKESPVLWCTECQTSIAQAELESTEKETTFNTIRFKLASGDDLLIATTRPELLFGTVCIFVNPRDERYGHLIGDTALVPLYEHAIPILGDEQVSIDKGTGVVMCATFGDTTDLEWYEKHTLPYRHVINADGTIASDVPLIGGLHLKKARRAILALLEERQLLIHSEIIHHTTSVHERCGTPIEIIPSKQWYIDILSEKQRFLDAADEINWHPEHMKSRYINWVENLKWDWCISRQRYFGIPFPLWYCSKCGEPMMAEPHQLPINPMETQPERACACGNTEFIPETAVMDTWATSSTTPMINAKWLEEEGDISQQLLPMSMRTQAHEIIRTWAFYSIVKSLYHFDRVPWKDIMICGFVLAKKGEKISKSKNNATLTPQSLIETHSADAIRYWAATAKLGTDTFFSEEDLKVSKRFINKLWNASKFAMSHLNDFDRANEMKLLATDKWIIERAKETMLSAQKHLDNYEIGLARHEIDLFFWRDFCDHYLEIVKERLYQPEKHGHLERRGAQYALYVSLLILLKLYAIFIPHMTEYLYQQFYREREGKVSLHQLRWCDGILLKDKYLYFGDEIKRIISDVRKAKSEQSLSMKSEIELLEIQCSPELVPFMIESKLDLAACCNAKKLTVNKRRITL